MRDSLKSIGGKSIQNFLKMNKDEWMRLDPAQITLLVNLVAWVSAVEKALKNNGLKVALDEQIVLLKNLILCVQGKIDKPLRQKIMCMITMDAHSRDIISQLIDANVQRDDEFQW